MKERCSNPRDISFRNYGGRGIDFDPRWAKFANFLKDMGVRSSGTFLDRVDNSKGYSKENCRWVPKETQANNTRTNRNVTAFGKTRTMSEWAKLKGIKVGTLWRRLNELWDAERALSQPVRSRRTGVGSSGEELNT